MSTDETYNGYTNRETWALNLHWQNDQGLYLETLERARDYLRETYGADWADMPADEMQGAAYGVGELIRDHWEAQCESWSEETGEPTPEILELMRRDVGSWWRVDVAEIGAAVVESLGIES